MVTAYSPLGGAKKDESGQLGVLDNEVIKEISERLKISPAQIVLAWLLARGIAVIPKSVHQDRIRENFAAQVIDLDATDMEKIAAIDKGKRFVDGSAFAFGDYKDIFA